MISCCNVLSYQSNICLVFFVQSLDHFCTKMLTGFYSISACPLTCYIDCTTVYFVKGVIRLWCLFGGVKVQSLDHFCTKMLTDY